MEAKHTPDTFAAALDAVVAEFGHHLNDNEIITGLEGQLTRAWADACEPQPSGLWAAAPDLLEAAIAHIAARQALAETAVDSLAQDDPRFKAVADTLADLEAAIAKATREPT